MFGAVWRCGTGHEGGEHTWSRWLPRGWERWPRAACFNLKAPPQAAQVFHCKPQHGGSSASDYWYELSGEEGQSEEEEHSKDKLKDYLALDQLKQTKTSTEQDAVDSCVVEKAPGAVSERGSDGPAVPS